MTGITLNDVKLCRDCTHALTMVGGSDMLTHWQCSRRIDVVTGQFVLCRDERAGQSMSYPLEAEAKETWSCSFFGRH